MSGAGRGLLNESETEGSRHDSLVAAVKVDVVLIVVVDLWYLI